MLGCVVGGLGLATHGVAAGLRYDRTLGAPLTHWVGRPVYPPWQWMIWAPRFAPRHPQLFDRANLITFGAAALGLTGVVLSSILRRRRPANSTAHGSARWASDEELARAGLGAYSGRSGQRFRSIRARHRSGATGLI